jgi:hypothetical protein
VLLIGREKMIEKISKDSFHDTMQTADMVFTLRKLSKSPKFPRDLTDSIPEITANPETRLLVYKYSQLLNSMLEDDKYDNWRNK